MTVHDEVSEVGCRAAAARAPRRLHPTYYYNVTSKLKLESNLATEREKHGVMSQKFFWRDSLTPEVPGRGMISKAAGLKERLCLHWTNEDGTEEKSIIVS